MVDPLFLLVSFPLTVTLVCIYGYGQQNIAKIQGANNFIDKTIALIDWC